MPDEILTPDEGTEQANVTPQENVDVEQPQVLAEGAEAEETTPEAPQPETPAQPDWKSKATEQGRENILLNERVRAANSRIESLTKQDTPTDEAMRKLYPEWDQLDDYNKRVLIRQETAAMRAARLEAEQAELKARLKLDDELEDVIETSEFAPKLKGKEAAFKRFAKQKKNIGIPADVLAKAFLFEPDEEAPAPIPNPEPMPTEALPTGSGGPRTPLKPKKISIEEAAKIRKTDINRWRELLKAGAIDDDIE